MAILLEMAVDTKNPTYRVSRIGSQIASHQGRLPAIHTENGSGHE